MTEQIKITPDGEAVIPKDVCEKLHWQPGMELQLLSSAGRVIVETKPVSEERISWEEFRRRVPPHDGPPVTLEEMEAGIEEGRRERWARKERRSR